MTSMGKPKSFSAWLRKSSLFLASLRVWVATARTKLGPKPDSLSENRAKQSHPRCMASWDSIRSASSPLPCLTVSLRYSTRRMCPCSNTPISKRKLLEPKSMAANNCPFCISILQSCSKFPSNFPILCLNFVILMTNCYLFLHAYIALTCIKHSKNLKRCLENDMNLSQLEDRLNGCCKS